MACGGWGDPELPKTPMEILDWARSFVGLAPIPEWVFELLNILRETEDGVSLDDTKIR